MAGESSKELSAASWRLLSEFILAFFTYCAEDSPARIFFFSLTHVQVMELL